MLLQGRSSKPHSSRFLSRGLYIEALLAVIIIVTLLATALPALKHYNKRSQYRELLDLSVPVKSTIEKCLGLKRNSTNCDEEPELNMYGGISQYASSSSVLESIEVDLENDRYTVTFTPPESNSVIPFIDKTITLIITAEIVDRNGRPVIEEWKTSPKSGCKTAGLC